MDIQRSYKETHKNKKTGSLYLVGTPIGNLNDMTFRAVQTLKDVDFIAAEDTRQTIKLLNHYEINKPLVSYHEHNKELSGVELIEKLKNGKNVALVSDAGTPAISDPGYELVVDAVKNEIPVIPILGANAALSGLIASGLPTQRFIFLGFLPRVKKDAIKDLEQYINYKETLIFYEAPHRIKKTMPILEEVLGNRKIVIIRELTKLYEEFIRGTVAEVKNYVNDNEIRGELTIIIEGSSGTNEPTKENWWDQLTIPEHVGAYIKNGENQKDALKLVARDRNQSKREIYNIYHQL